MNIEKTLQEICTTVEIFLTYLFLKLLIKLLMMNGMNLIYFDQNMLPHFFIKIEVLIEKKENSFDQNDLKKLFLHNNL
jgi:hypothetical protein